MIWNGVRFTLALTGFILAGSEWWVSGSLAWVGITVLFGFWWGVSLVLLVEEWRFRTWEEKTGNYLRDLEGWDVGDLQDWKSSGEHGKDDLP